MIPKAPRGATCPLIFGFAVIVAACCSDKTGLKSREESAETLADALFLLADLGV